MHLPIYKKFFTYLLCEFIVIFIRAFLFILLYFIFYLQICFIIDKYLSPSDRLLSMESDTETYILNSNSLLLFAFIGKHCTLKYHFNTLNIYFIFLDL